MLQILWFTARDGLGSEALTPDLVANTSIRTITMSLYARVDVDRVRKEAFTPH